MTELTEPDGCRVAGGPRAVGHGGRRPRPAGRRRGQPAEEPSQGRRGPPLGPALHPRDRLDGRPAAPVGDAARPRRLGSHLRSPTRWRRPRSWSRGCSTRCRCTWATRCASSGPRRGPRPTSASRTRPTTSACPDGSSRSGCGAPAVVCWRQVSDGVSFEYKNTNPYRPDQAEFVHLRCSGWARRQDQGQAQAPSRRAGALPDRLLEGSSRRVPLRRVGAPRGHVPEGARPALRMKEWKSNIGPDVQIICKACNAQRGMLEATGRDAKQKLPSCRGRHPHLDAFFACDEPGRLMMLGAANQWFSNTVGLLALPREDAASAGGVGSRRSRRCR